MPRSVRIALLDRMKLRPKLAAAFLCLSILIGVCGASGLAFVYGIGATLTVFAEVTSPLLGQTVVLADNAQRMRGVFLDVISRGPGPTGEAASDLGELDLAAGQVLAKFERLLTETKLPVRFDEIGQLQHEFFQGLIAMLTAHTQQRIAVLSVEERLRQFEAGRRDFDSLLRTVTARGEAVLAEKRDEAALQVSAGTATIEGLDELFSSTMNEAYPLVKGLYKLTRDAVTLQEVATSYISITEPEALLVVERRATLTFANAGAVVDSIALALQTSEGQGYVKRFRSALDGLRDRLMGDKGLFAAHREYLLVKDGLTRMQNTLAANETRYVSSLEEVRQLVEEHNERAKARAAQMVHQALGFIGTVVLAGLLIGLVFSLVFTKRIVGPITRIT